MSILINSDRFRGLTLPGLRSSGAWAQRLKSLVFALSWTCVVLQSASNARHLMLGAGKSRVKDRKTISLPLADG